MQVPYASSLSLLFGLAGAMSGLEPSFRTSLTATVQESSARDGCSDVVLSWRAHPDAKRYRVLVSRTRVGAWGDVPAKTGCAQAVPQHTMSFVDREPVTPDAATWLYYRVVAIGLRAPLDTTDVVPIELTSHDLSQPK
jgi:hypothetical protein